MDQRIIALESSTFSGRRLNRQQIADIQETVALLPDDSRNELAKTICEHLRWTTAKGDCRVGACLGMLETLEIHGILTLPPKREDHVRDMTSTPAWSERGRSAACDRRFNRRWEALVAAAAAVAAREDARWQNAPPRVRQPADHALRVPPRRRAARAGL